MLYLIYGTDSHKSRKKLQELLKQAEKKRPEALLFRLTTENWSETQLEELIVSQGLFEQKYTVVLDNLFENKNAKDFVLERIKEISESDQVFLMLEAKIDALSLKKIEKYAKQVQEFTKAESNKPDSNIFFVTKGLIEKDKKTLWIDLLRLFKEGVGPEEIHGVLFWQLKSMLLASLAKDQKETGLSPFVYKNALTGSRKYKNEELREMSSSLVEMTHRVRQGEGELGIMLEKWVLGL